jgi:predicted kinase
MKNSLGIEVTRPDDIMIIMRGIPGAGKSTIAERLKKDKGIIHSTDAVIEKSNNYREFFNKMIESKNFAPLGRAHSTNFKNAKKSIEEGISPIIIDNTNIKANECKKYVVEALNAGYADENIEFVEVGDAGLTAEVLAERNTHGVPLDKIKSMIASYKSVGNLTLEKVIGAKDMYKKKPLLFASVVLDDNSQNKLVTALRHHIPEGWEIIAHHMTINFGKGLGPDRKEDEGKKVTLVATEIGISDMVIAVKVHGYPSDNALPHITLGVNRAEGGKPVMSNDIKNWEKLGSHINLTGVVTEQRLG